MTTAQDGGKVVGLKHRPPLPPGNTVFYYSIDSISITINLHPNNICSLSWIRPVLLIQLKILSSQWLGIAQLNPTVPLCSPSQHDNPSLQWIQWLVQTRTVGLNLCYLDSYFGKQAHSQYNMNFKLGDGCRILYHRHTSQVPTIVLPHCDSVFPPAAFQIVCTWAVGPPYFVGTMWIIFGKVYQNNSVPCKVKSYWIYQQLSHSQTLYSTHKMSVIWFPQQNEFLSFHRIKRLDF